MVVAINDDNALIYYRIISCTRRDVRPLVWLTLGTVSTWITVCFLKLKHQRADEDVWRKWMSHLKHQDRECLKPITFPTKIVCVYLLDFFAPVFSFMYYWALIFALSPFLYLYLYVLGDDAWISNGSFMQTKHIFVLVHNWTKGDVGAPWNCPPSSKIFLLTVPRQYFLWIICVIYVLCLACFRVCSLLPCGLVCDVYFDFVTFPFGILGQVWYLIPDHCCLSYFFNHDNTTFEL